MELANSIVTLQPGMYILRHPKTGLPPISISRAAGKKEHNGTIQALYTPGTDGSVLRDGRDCIVMQVLNGAVDLLVTAYLEKTGAAVPSLKIDKIALESDAMTASTTALEIPPTGISLIGHIERVGDRVTPVGQRLGDPSSDLRLEGFQVMWPDKPADVDLVYSANIEGTGITSTVSTGKFCGTRNAAKRLVGVKFELAGVRSADYELGGMAYFSGGFTSAISSGALLSGPSGLEHLTALSISVTDNAKNKAKKNPWEASPRTRVLKNPGTSSKKP
jgi:hypothetical protein